MNIVDIINKKRVGEVLTKEELDYAFNGYLKGTVKDYQMSSLLMAICINGMDEHETFALTDIFINSGDILDLSSIPGVKVDKHSTGGVGDKVTLIIGPIVSSTGCVVPKMSGRGLGHTGGTIDKLESIAGFNTSLSEEEFINQVKRIGLAVIGQTKNLCPIDKVIYALRDVTGTTSSIPLIATSIMSKKIAGGADKILLDVKVGNGALMKTREEGEKLAALMKKIGKNYNREVICEITDMNIPLGDNIGNSLEVMEAMDILNGKKGRLYDLCIEIASQMISLAKNISMPDARIEAINAIDSKRAYNKFLEFVKEQGGDINSLKVSDKTIEVKSTKTGVIKEMNALALGELSVSLGAGRRNKEDEIDHTVGIVLEKHLDEHVELGETLCTLYVNDMNVSIDPDDYFKIV